MLSFRPALFGYLHAALTERALIGRVLLTVVVLAAMRALSHVPVPGVVRDIPAGNLAAVLGGMQLMGGASAGVVSLVALGVGPLVVAMIVTQVAGRVVPALSQMRERPGGEQDMARFTRKVAFGLASVQALSLALTLRADGFIAGGTRGLVACVVCLAAGAMVVCWFSDRISRNGLGDGVSVLIGASVVVAIAGQVSGWWADGVVVLLIGGGLLVGMAAVVVWLSEAQRRFPVLVANARARLPEGQSSYLPIVAMMAGVMPAIFAGAVLNAPQMLSGLVPGAGGIADMLLPGTWGGVLFEAVLVGAFSLLYLPMVFDPWKVAKSMSNRGVFIPGVIPGDPTAEAIARETERLARRGGVALALLVAVPGLLTLMIPGAPALPMGTSVIILAGVGIALAQRIGVESHIAFMNRQAERQHRALADIGRA